MQASPLVRAEIQPEVWLDSRLALWLERPRLLVAADLHWGYAASHRRQGNLLPLWGDEEISGRLDRLIADYQPAEMIWLGDSLHTREGRVTAEAYLDRAAVPITVLAGNHDRSWQRAQSQAERRDAYFFHHGDLETAVPAGCLEIVGHHHPSVGWSDGAGGRLKLPALVAAPGRLILPAFSPWAAGAPWNHRLQAGESLWGVSPQRILPFGAATALSA